jgi:hypothetical protein
MDGKKEKRMNKKQRVRKQEGNKNIQRKKTRNKEVKKETQT